MLRILLTIVLLGQVEAPNPHEVIVKSRAIVEVENEQVEQLNEVGKVLSVQKVEEEKFPTPAFSLEINGFDSNVPLGELVDISIVEKDAKPDARSYVWEVSSQQLNYNIIDGVALVTLKDGPKPHKVWPDNKSIVFGAGTKPITYKVKATVSYSYKTETGVVVKSDSKDLDVTVDTGGKQLRIPLGPQPKPNPEPQPKPNPEPDPKPNPEPEPKPEVPDGHFGFGKTTYELINKYVKSSKKEGSEASAKALSIIVERIADGKYNKVGDEYLVHNNGKQIKLNAQFERILLDLNDGKNGLLVDAFKDKNVNKMDWSEFGATWGDKLMSVYKENIKSLDDIRTLLQDIIAVHEFVYSNKG